MIKNTQLLIIITVINIILWGCASRKINSCNLIKETTSQLNNSVVVYLDSEDIDKIREVADKFKGAEEQILSSDITDKSLLTSAKILANIYNKYSEITNNYLSAYQERDTEKIIKYKEEIVQLFTQQENVIQEINNYCLQE
jgi:hypothetical protein